MHKNLTTSYDDCPVKIEKQEYLRIVKAFMKFIVSELLEGKSVKLPAGMGELEVVGKRIKPKLDEEGNIVGLAPDWVKTKKLWDEDPQARKERRKIYHFNEHTNGVRYKIHWTKNTYNIINKVLYNFMGVRQLKRGIWKAIVENDKEFRIGN